MFKLSKLLLVANLVCDLKSVEEAGTADLELDIVGVLLYLDALGVLPPGLQQEILDFLDLTWHCGYFCNNCRFYTKVSQNK